MAPDRVVIHTDTQPSAPGGTVTERHLDLMFAKARAASTLGQHFTLELADRRVTLTVTADRVKIAETHYTEQLRLATEEENRVGVQRAKAVLRSVGDPHPEATIGFVGAGAAFEAAMSEHLVQGLVEMGLREPVGRVLDDMERRLDRGDVL